MPPSPPASMIPAPATSADTDRSGKPATGGSQPRSSSYRATPPSPAAHRLPEPASTARTGVGGLIGGNRVQEDVIIAALSTFDGRCRALRLDAVPALGRGRQHDSAG